MSDPKPGIDPFTDEERLELISRILEANQHGLTTDEITSIVHELGAMRVEGKLAELVLAGKVLVHRVVGGPD